MKSVIIYASTHQGNTRKIVEAIRDALDIKIIDATTIREIDFSDYDIIGFASGIYAGKFHKTVLEVAGSIPSGKSVFFITSSAMANPKYDKTIRGVLADKNPNILGSLATRGMTTFGPFKIVGGAMKGRPNEEDIKEAIEFVQEIINIRHASTGPSL